MFIPITDILAPSSRQALHIQPTSLTSTPPPPAVHKRRRKAQEERSPDEMFQAEKSYQQVRHMAYLAVIQEAYRNFTVEG